MPRVWIFLFFGYNGQNFHGMQHQKETNVRPIENLLIDRLFKAGFLPTSDYFELVKTHKWGRAARTDKGVHAILNGISCLFTIPEKFYDGPKLLQKEKLLISLKEIFEDTQIIIHGFRKVTTRFEVRQMVKARTYSYICPIKYFTEYSKEAMTVTQTQQLVQKVNVCCNKFIGTHNFHNYTRGIKAKDPQAKRVIHEFSCARLQAGWLQFTIKGQSFIYHQIRKIIGAIIEVFMNNYDPGYLDNTFFNNQIVIPLAPSHGLYLRNLHFDSYNRRNDIPEKLEFGDEGPELEKLEQTILIHIKGLPEEKWSSWYQETREGIPAKQEDADGAAGLDDC